MITIFAGAGASMAVNTKKFPATKEFFTQLPNDIKENKLFNEIVNFIKQEEINESLIDIEEILFPLYKLREMLVSTENKKNAFGWLLNANRLPSLTNTKDVSQIFIDMTSKLHNQTRNLINMINEQVYNLYYQNPDKKELQSNWSFLLKLLMEKNDQIEIFTTNYDLVIESALHFLDNNRHKVITGRAEGPAPIIEPDMWPSTDLMKPLDDKQTMPERYIRLTKLHGSVDWIRRPDGKIGCGNPVFTGNHNQHLIIYPGFKDNPKDELLSRFHFHFSDCLRNTKNILYIGFAFRDQYINSLIEKSFLPFETMMTVIDPASNLPNLPFMMGQTKHIKEKFNQQAVKRFLEQVN